LKFLKNAARFVAQAPVHRTRNRLDAGAVPPRGGGGRAARRASYRSIRTNQFLAVAIQLGLVGGAILIAMWIAHFALFRGAGLVAWIGVVVVTQNVVSSLFNSHLFDFFHGWLYVFGVGVLGGMVLRARARSANPTAERS